MIVVFWDPETAEFYWFVTPVDKKHISAIREQWHAALEGWA